MPAVELSKHEMETLVNRVRLWNRIDAGEFDEGMPTDPWPAQNPPDGKQYIVNYYDKSQPRPRQRIVTVHCVRDSSGNIVHRDVKYVVVGSKEYKAVD